MKKNLLTVIILTKNEEERISDCIDSVVGWADEIIVFDDESRDRTKEIAESKGAKVFVKKMEVEGTHRNWAYGHATCEWVLSLDADERMTSELKDEITEKIALNPKEDAFTMPRKNYIGDYWIRGGGLYPAAQLKLFRKDKFKWEEVEVHPRAFLDDRENYGHLKKDMIHYSYRDWSDFLSKSNRQTTLEAKKWYNVYLEKPGKARYKMNVYHAVWRGLNRFRSAFINRRGYIDGFIGFMIAYFACLYQIISCAKFWELYKNDPRNKKK